MRATASGAPQRYTSPYWRIIMQEIVQLISTVGFPIAACLGMGWYISKTQENLRQVVEENTKAVLLLTERLHTERAEDDADK